MQKTVRIHTDDYDKLKALSEQAGVPLSKYLSMILSSDKKQLDLAIQKAYQTLARLEALARPLP